MSFSCAVSKPPPLPNVDVVVSLAALSIAGISGFIACSNSKSTPSKPSALSCLFSANTFFLSNNGERTTADKDVGGVAIFGGGGGIASLLSTSCAVFVSSSSSVCAVSVSVSVSVCVSV